MDFLKDLVVYNWRTNVTNLIDPLCTIAVILRANVRDHIGFEQSLSVESG